MARLISIRDNQNKTINIPMEYLKNFAMYDILSQDNDSVINLPFDLMHKTFEELPYFLQLIQSYNVDTKTYHFQTQVNPSAGTFLSINELDELTEVFPPTIMAELLVIFNYFGSINEQKLLNIIFERQVDTNLSVLFLIASKINIADTGFEHFLQDPATYGYFVNVKPIEYFTHFVKENIDKYTSIIEFINKYFPNKIHHNSLIIALYALFNQCQKNNDSRYRTKLLKLSIIRAPSFFIDMKNQGFCTDPVSLAIYQEIVDRDTRGKYNECYSFRTTDEYSEQSAIARNFTVERLCTYTSAHNHGYYVLDSHYPLKLGYYKCDSNEITNVEWKAGDKNNYIFEDTGPKQYFLL